MSIGVCLAGKPLRPVLIRSHCHVCSFVAEALGEPSSGRILSEAAASRATELLPVSVHNTMRHREAECLSWTVLHPDVQGASCK